MIKILLLLSTGLFASELIHSHSDIENLDKRLRQRNYDLGKPITPYFYSNNLPSRVFKNFSNRCTKVVFYSNSISTRKTKCNIKYNYNLAQYPNFKLVDSNFKFKEESILLREEKVSSSYLGSSYKFHLRDLYDTSNLKRFEFSLTSTSTLKKKDSSFVLVQNIKYQREQFHFIPLKEENFTQTISYSPKKGDLLFKDDNDDFILYKKYQPGPFTFTYMWLNESYVDYLNKIPNLLFNSNNQSYCFMDTSYNPSPYDCEDLALKRSSFSTFNPIELFIIR